MLLHVLRTCRCAPSRARRRTEIPPVRARVRSCHTPVGPRKMNEPIGRFGSLSPARERRIALATRTSASSCPTTRWRSAVLHGDELLDLAFEHLRDRNASPLRNDAARRLLRQLLPSTCARHRSSSICVGELLELFFRLADQAHSESRPRAADCPCALRSAPRP